jgi:hypothetical protein
VCGGRVVDLSALQAATQYDDGYNQHSAAIRWFWEVSEKACRNARRKDSAVNWSGVLRALRAAVCFLASAVSTDTYCSGTASQTGQRISTA